MKSITSKKSKAFFAILIMSIILTVALAMPTILTAFGAEYYGSFLFDKPYNTSYSNIDEVRAASADVANKISAEGTVLLKNDGALPLAANQKISLFGTNSGKMTQMKSGLEAEGFGVNANSAISTGNVAADSDTLPENYATDVKERNEFFYNDAAIVMFDEAFGAVSGENSGFGFIQNAPVKKGEGGGKGPGAEVEGTGNGITDPQNASVEDFKDADGQQYILPSGTVFKQKNLAHTVYDNKEKKYVTVFEEYTADEQFDGKDRYTITYYKHPLMLSEAAEKLISYTTKNFETVIVLFMSANQLEVGILDQNPGISAILWSGDRNSNTNPDHRNNIHQIAKIISGTINPSGKTINTWARDFSNSSNWMNDGNSGVTFASVDGKDASEWEAGRIFHGSSFAMGLRDSEGRYYIRAKRTGNNKRKNALPVMYEEDIYMGYRYYETAAAEAAASNYTGFNYADEVVYPFGHGLSYTTFDKEIVSSDVDAWTEMNNSGWDIENWKNDGKMTVNVKVTNTGKYAGKEVVEIYGHAPYYTDGVAKSEVVLVGFEKTKLLAPGASQTVKVTVKVRDLASFDWNDANGNGSTTYELDKNASTDTKGNALSASSGDGKYELRLQNDSHNVAEYEGKAQKVVLADLTKDILLDKSEGTGNEITTVFSEGSLEDTLSYDPKTKQNMVDDGKMTLLERSDFAGTWPEMSTPADMTRSDEYFDLLDASNDFNADTFYTSNELLVKQTSTVYDNKGKNTYDNGTSSQSIPVDSPYYDLFKGTEGAAAATAEDNSDLPWAMTKEEFMTETGNGTETEWSQMKDSATQAEAKATAGNDWILFYEMKGIDPNSEDTISDGKFKGKTGKEVWNDLLNQLTFEELKTIILYGGFNTTTIESIDRPNSRHCDDMMGLSRQGVHSRLRIQFGDSPVNAATWNKQLQWERGLMVGECGLWSGVVGWYGVGGNLHRSAFGGRNPEYYGEDPFLIGHISGSHGAAAEAKGLITYVKHNGLNESETGRYNRHTYLTEQAAREIYFKGFQICLEDYELRGTMTSYNNIGDRQAASNHAYQWNIVRQEWGFMGLSLTDAVTPKEISYTSDIMVRAGGSQTLANITTSSGDAYHYDRLSGTYDAENNKVTVKKQKVATAYTEAMAAAGTDQAKITEAAKLYKLEEEAAVDSYTQWYYVRMAAMHTLYAEANSSTSDRAKYNLYVGEGSEGTGSPYATADTPDVDINKKYSDKTFAVGVPVELDCAPATLRNYNAQTDGAYSYVLGEITIGSGKNATTKTSTLPEGLTLDSKTGKVSGTPTQAGTTTFTIWGGNLQGGWVRNVQKFTITIAEKTALAAPADVAVSNSTVSWSAVENATGYEITIDGYGTYTVGADKTSFGLPLMAEGEYNVTVKALGGGVYADSEVASTTYEADGLTQGPAGPAGPEGPVGPAGPKGDAAEGGCGSFVSTAGGIIGLIAFLVAGAVIIFVIKAARKDK